MSVIFKTHGTSVLNRVFIFYDFKQISDAILIVMFIKQSKSWEKIFVFNDGSRWKPEVLKNYMNERLYNSICKKLQLIFEQQTSNSGLNTDESIKDEPGFIPGINAVC